MDNIKNGMVSEYYVRSEDIMADIVTKALPKVQFEKVVQNIRME